MADRNIVRKLRTIVALDAAGYSRLMGQDEEGTHAALQSHIREVVLPAIAAHRGRSVKTTGDGLLAEFASVVEAVQCCLDIQGAMAERNEPVPAARRIEFRIGVNIGDVIIDGDDIFGDGVNIAARLEGIADPGGICLSAAAREQVRNTIAVGFQDLGELALRNIEAPVHAYRLAAKTDAPGAVDGSPRAPAFTAAPPRPSLAIMAFRNLNGDAENAFVAEGIALGIQTLLVQLPGLFFVNATVDRNYREGRATAAEALEGRPVRYVLEGAVQRAGARVRVTAKLTDLAANSVVWAERYDRDLEDVFDLQDEVTRDVIASISLRILQAPIGRIWIGDMAGDGAWEYFLRGLSHLYKHSQADNLRAREMFHRLCELRPDRSFGPGAIALSHWFDFARGWSAEPAESFREAREWAARAMAIPERNEGMGHAVMGAVRLVERNHDEALALCRQSIGFRASCPFAIGQLAAVQMYTGDPGGAAKTAREALGVRSSYLPQLVNILAAAYRDDGRFDLSIPAAREATRIDPGHVDAMVTLCSDFGLQGSAGEAAAMASEILRVDPEFRISGFVARQPYREPAQLDRIVGALPAAALPA